MLLLYHTSRRTEGADVPLNIVSQVPDVGELEWYLPGHHESSEIRNVELPLHVNADVDDHAQEGEQEAQRLPKSSAA